MKIIGRVDGDRKNVAKGERFEAIIVEVSPQEARHLRAHNDWINAVLYEGAVPKDKMLPGEIGRYGNCICVIDLTATRAGEEIEKVYFDELKEAYETMRERSEKPGFMGDGKG